MIRMPRAGAPAPRTSRLVGWGLAAALAVAAAGAAAPAVAEPADAPPLTNLAHLDFLLDTATPPPSVPGHTTYRLDEEPDLTMPWTYADAQPGGTFERVGGGTVDPATGHWPQGAYNADDIARAAVVYLRHWQLTATRRAARPPTSCCARSRTCRRPTGRTPATSCCGCSPTASSTRAPDPVELPDPSDSGPSYWLARTLWAFGEGYAAFAAGAATPQFAELPRPSGCRSPRRRRPPGADALRPVRRGPTACGCPRG